MVFVRFFATFFDRYLGLGALTRIFELNQIDEECLQDLSEGDIDLICKNQPLALIKKAKKKIHDYQHSKSFIKVNLSIPYQP